MTLLYDNMSCLFIFLLQYSIRILDLYQVISSYYINQAVIFDILPHWF